jgi:hypothetical protein
LNWLIQSADSIGQNNTGKILRDDPGVMLLSLQSWRSIRKIIPEHSTSPSPPDLFGRSEDIGGGDHPDQLSRIIRNGQVVDIICLHPD